MSLTIKHPDPEFSGSHSGLTFVDGVAEFPAIESDAREPLLANGFTIDGEDDVPETPEEEAARIAAEQAETARIAAEAEQAKADAEKAEAERLAAEKKAADEVEAQRLADEKAAADKKQPARK